MKKIFLFGVTAIGLLFTACQSDDISGPDNIPTDGDRTLYLNVNIRGDIVGNGSRATTNGDPSIDTEDFDGGTEDENNVVNAYFVFYDVNGNQVGGQPVPVDLSGVDWTQGEDGTVEKYYQSVVGVTVVNGQENPAQVICYLNPQAPEGLTASLQKIQEATRPALTVTNGTKEYFSMSNSVFYPTTASEAPQIAVQIANNQLFNTRQAAEAAKGDPALTVNIYVERYASKLSFQTAEPEDYVTKTRGINDDGEGTDVILSFVPKTWMLNASCTETYVVKSFREQGSDGNDILADNYAYQELNDIINKGGAKWQWNAPAYHRSYWAMSPAYFTSEYPEVSSDVKDIKGLNQHYYSYNELLSNLNGNVPAGFTLPEEGKTATEYVHETTVGSKALASKNIVAALPSVILVGDYTVTVDGTELPENTTFYTYLVISPENDHPLVYFEPATASTTGETDIAGGESILRGLLKAATNLYKQVVVNEETGETKYENFDFTDETDVQKLVAVLQVAEPSDEVKGALKVPERYRTLQFRSGATDTQLNGIYVGTADGYKQVIASSTATPTETQINKVTANQELMNVVGFCAKYEAGAAYFNIPVKHYGWYREANENNKEDATMNWSKVRVGDFGIVRNHSYTIDVTEILGLGTGIGGKDNPIVPPSEENRYYIAYSVNILKWALVPVQSVKL